MSDMSQVIVPKSDQINAEDFLAGPRTYTIESVEIRAGAEQPVSIHLRGEPRVWRPCKSMSRVLVSAWGPDASVYTGRSVTLYRDPTVKWGGIAVGGIRVSHLSHIDREMLLQLTATKGKRAPHMVKPLKVEQPQQKPTPAAVDDSKADDAAAQGMAAYQAFVKALPKELQRAYVATEAHQRRKETASAADDAAMLNDEAAE